MPRKGWRFFNRTKSHRSRYQQHDEVSAARLFNPYKNKTSHFKIRRTILPVFFIAWVGLLLYLPYFRISKIYYSGLKIIDQSEIDKIVKDRLASHYTIWPGNNYFIFNNKSLTQLLKNKFLLNSVTVTKVFPNTLDIKLQEKATAGIYDNGEAYYLLDKDGTNIKYLRSISANEFIFSTSTITSSTPTLTSSSFAGLTGTHVPNYQEIMTAYGDYPIIYDKGPKNINGKGPWVDNKIMNGLMTFYNAIRQVKTIRVNYLIIDGVGSGITAITDKPYRIVFQPTDDIDDQISRLQIFLKNNRALEYVDLRFGGRIYWK